MRQLSAPAPPLAEQAVAEVHATTTWGAVFGHMALTCQIKLLASALAFAAEHCKCRREHCKSRKLTNMESFWRRTAHNPLELSMPFD